MSKFRIAVLVLLAVTVVYAVMLALNFWNYCQIETEGFDSDLGHWFGTLEPFFATSEGLMFFMAGVVLFFTWLIIATMLSPYAILWYYLVKRHELNYIKILLDNKPRVWDIEKTLREYIELLKKKNREAQP